VRGRAGVGVASDPNTAAPAPLQRQQTGEAQATDPRAIAAAGVQGGGTTLPHLDTIQHSFGRHDVTSVQAHVGGAAADAATAIGAQAYATGNDVAFAAQPDLHTAAHEAAHVIQQRAGVQLKGGVGEVGDAYERHADHVADAVVAGRSAEAILDSHAPAAGSDSVQRKEAPGAESRASLVLEPTVVPFPAADVGQPQVRTVQISNPGPAVVTIEDVTVDAAAFEVTYVGPTQLAPGERAQVQVVFAPTAEGWAEATVSVAMGGGTRASARVSGAGLPARSYGPHLPGEEAGDASVDGYVAPPEPQPEPRPDANQRRLDERFPDRSRYDQELDTCHPARDVMELPKDPDCPTVESDDRDPVKRRGERAVEGWSRAASDLIHHYHDMTIEELNLYLMRTASNPGLSSLSMPDPSFLRGFFQNAFGAAVGAAAEGNYQRGARRQAARRGAGAARAARAARTSAATAGSAGGLPGRAIGFLAVVFIENMAEMLYHGLAGSSDRALREAYGRGHTQGARDHGTRLMAAMEELGGARDMALGQIADDHALLDSLIKNSSDPEELERLVAHAEGLHKQAADAYGQKPDELGLARELLTRWVLDHAATPTESTADVEDSQWHAAIKDLATEKDDRVRDKDNEGTYNAARGTLSNRPDLFVHQSVRQWHAAGLPIEAYKEEMTSHLEALMASGDSALGATLRRYAHFEPADALAANRIAQAARDTFHMRPFVWSGYLHWDGAQKRFHQYETSGPGKGGVRCYPVLEVAEQSCYVKEWRWEVSTATGLVQAISVPGDAGWRRLP
jgi:hypothetical protein